MVKLSAFPDGTLVDVDNEPFKKHGSRWSHLIDSGCEGEYSLTLVAMDVLQSRGQVAIIGVPYPVALKLAELLDGSRNPEELILDVAKGI